MQKMKPTWKSISDYFAQRIDAAESNGDEVFGAWLRQIFLDLQIYLRTRHSRQTKRKRKE